jgi:hypothetical protein
MNALVKNMKIKPIYIIIGVVLAGAVYYGFQLGKTTDEKLRDEVIYYQNKGYSTQMGITHSDFKNELNYQRTYEGYLYRRITSTSSKNELRKYVEENSEQLGRHPCYLCVDFEAQVLWFQYYNNQTDSLILYEWYPN